MTKEQIERLSVIEANLSSIVMQRQSLQKQLLEIDYALSQIKDVKEGYEIIGTIMIKKSSKILLKELTEKKETTTIKLSSVKKQEEITRSQMKQTQEAIMSQMKGDEK